MAKFCRFCGSPLEEGQVCACQSAAPVATPEATPVEAPVAVATAPATGNPLLNSLKSALQGLLKAPKATAAAMAEDKNGMAVAGIFAGVNALAVFFFIWRMLGQLASMVSDMMGGMLGGLGSMMGGLDEMPDLELEYPILPMLVSGILIAALGIALTALAVFVVGKICKKEVDIKKLLVIESVNSGFHSALLILGILLGFISWELQVIVLSLMMILWMVTTCTEIRGIAAEDAHESTKALGIQTGILVVTYAIAVFAIYKLSGWCFEELSIDGVTLGEAFEQIGNLGGLMGGLF